MSSNERNIAQSNNNWKILLLCAISYYQQQQQYPRDRVGIPLPTNINPYEEIGEIPDCILSSHIVHIHKYDIPGHLISSSSLSAPQNYYSSVDGVI